MAYQIWTRVHLIETGTLIAERETLQEREPDAEEVAIDAFTKANRGSYEPRIVESEQINPFFWKFIIRDTYSIAGDPELISGDLLQMVWVSIHLRLDL